MPQYSGVTSSVQEVEQEDSRLGYVISSFGSKNQLAELRNFLAHGDHDLSTRWRGEYHELAKALIRAIDSAT
jgi:hypothetical protein